MHLIIANQIAEKIPIPNKEAFLIGGIAPDAVSPKELSHFFDGNPSDFSRRIDYGKFYEKYSSFEQQDYILGYYTHLITDDLWLTGFYLAWLKNRIENDEVIFKRYHYDFQLLNGKLLSYYNIETDLLTFIDEVDFIPDLAEVTVTQVEKFLPYVKEDMIYNKEDLDERLTVFRFEQIIGYIETAIEKSKLLLKEKL